MAKTWYPVVDYSLCVECGTCVTRCPHGVYDLSKAPTPVVANPEACVDHCHGCGNRCPEGAITYVGEDTGWTPPNGRRKAEEPCCCGGADSSGKKVRVEYLYLDLESCGRCIETGKALDEVMMVVTPALRLAGYEVEYEKVEIKTAEVAERYRFVSSPTVLVNGRDVLGQVEEDECGCCSEMSGEDVECRVFKYGGKTHEAPPKEMLAEAILKAVFGPEEGGCSCAGYELPDNLRAFFEGKSRKSACSCNDGCC